jgi:hypothetical protein
VPASRSAARCRRLKAQRKKHAKKKASKKTRVVPVDDEHEHAVDDEHRVEQHDDDDEQHAFHAQHALDPSRSPARPSRSRPRSRAAARTVRPAALLSDERPAGPPPGRFVVRALRLEQPAAFASRSW